jgi:transcriptional regulator with XRE-family HTH domain
MGTAEKIRTFRVRAGKSAQEIATALGLNEAWYRDLESYDDELASTLTLFQASQLATLLGVRLKDLVDENPSCEEKKGLLDLPGSIQTYLVREQLSVEDLEELVGWEIQSFLRSPVAAAAEMPIAFLRDISSHLGISLLSLLPDAHAH